MDRLISEQAVIESIEFFQMNPQHFDFVNLIDDIKDIPSAEPRWIPVSERLPEKSGFYLVSTTDCITIMEFSNGWISQNIGSCNWYVKAWMPLPEPYKTESEGKE